jgi:hypothetical protein
MSIRIGEFCVGFFGTAPFRNFDLINDLWEEKGVSMGADWDERANHEMGIGRTSIRTKNQTNGPNRKLNST